MEIVGNNFGKGNISEKFRQMVAGIKWCHDKIGALDFLHPIAHNSVVKIVIAAY